MKRFGKILVFVPMRLMAFVGKGWLHFFVAVQCVILAGFGVYYLKKEFFVEQVKKFDKNSLPQAPVEVVNAAKTTFEDKVTLLGKIVGDKHVVIKSEIDGRLKTIPLEENVSVDKGKVLFTMEDAVYKAELAEARAQLALSEAKLKRDTALAQRNAKAAKEVEEAAAQVDVYRATVEKRKAALDRTVIRAPFPGTVGMRTLSEGAWVRPGDELVSITSSGSSLEFCLPEKYLDSLDAGDGVVFETDSAEGRRFTAKVTHVDAHSHPHQHCVRCRASVKVPPSVPLRHGMYARVHVVTRRNEDVVVVPQSAVETRGKISFVYVVDGDKAAQKLVRLGGRSGDKIEILGGLNEGDQVITAGQMKIQDGFPVYVLPPKSF